MLTLLVSAAAGVSLTAHSEELPPGKCHKQTITTEQIKENVIDVTCTGSGLVLVVSNDSRGKDEAERMCNGDFKISNARTRYDQVSGSCKLEVVDCTEAEHRNGAFVGPYIECPRDLFGHLSNDENSRGFDHGRSNKAGK